jgi:hypothetical protein
MAQCPKRMGRWASQNVDLYEPFEWEDMVYMCHFYGKIWKRYIMIEVVV